MDRRDKVKTERGANLLKLQEKAKSLPSRPGCYLMKNKSGDVIYVGKAKKLKLRVSSYFQKGAKSPKTEVLVSHIRDFDFILADSESEAFILENTLIKKYTPKYNIMMRDDKSYPYVVVDYNEKFPRLEYKRRWKRRKGLEILGPFAHGSNISEVLRILVKSFKLRDCSLREFLSRKDPCLLYQIKQCSAPCVSLISQDDYLNDLAMALSFFKGKGRVALKSLNEQMHAHAQKEEFETAAILRDHIMSLEDFVNRSQQKNAEFVGDDINVDVIASFEGEEEIDFAFYIIRKGMLLGHKNFHLLKADLMGTTQEALRDFVLQYYLGSHDLYPDKVIVDELDDLLVSTFAASKELSKVKISLPKKKFASLMGLAKEQARESQSVRIKQQDSPYIGLQKLGELLGMKERPQVLECYDIAIFQGQSPAAAQIVFEEGKAVKSRYRHYHLEERPEGNNDFAMMEEVLTRRIKHGQLPDVFIVDGGKGQVSAFEKVLEEKKISIPVCGIAKDKAKNNFKSDKIKRTEERLVIPGRANPYYLSKNKSLFKILTHMRDEAHRFSRRLHHKNEEKKLFTSWLDQVEGIGPKTRDKILSNLTHTKEQLREMTKEEIAATLGVSKKVAANIVKILV